jgi:uncharacterized protein
MESEALPIEPRSDYAERATKLERFLADCGSLAIAYSGGVDSGVLLHAARRVLGERATAVIADSPSLARSEFEAALAFARSIGVEPVVLGTSELEDPRYQRNAGDRCYFCKSALFEAMSGWAREHGVRRLAFGEIVDDLSDHRPGARAAREFEVLAPLSAAGFTKLDVRRYARENELPLAEKPASACLASRIPVGVRVTREKLARVERAEEVLKRLGWRQVRVRDHGALARIEVGADELARAREQLALASEGLNAAGFSQIELHAYVPPAQRAR